MTTKLLQLDEPIEVRVVSADLPKGMTQSARKGFCIAWWATVDTHLWLVVFDDTGELVWVPMHEIRMRPNWTSGRRFAEAPLTTLTKG